MVQRLTILLLLLTVYITTTLSFTQYSRTSTITMTTIDKSKSLTQADYRAKLTSKSKITSTGKSAFVLFCIMNLCVQYKLLVWLLYLNLVCLRLITFHITNKGYIISLFTSLLMTTRIFQMLQHYPSQVLLLHQI